MLIPDLEFNIRSFHPEENFGWSGLYFEGDNRGFSLEPSVRPTDSDERPETTSRIWQRFEVKPRNNLISVPAENHSNRSRAFWQSEARYYNVPETRPQGDARITFAGSRQAASPMVRIQGEYSGRNWAMPLARGLKERTGHTYVPALDVSYSIILQWEPNGRYLDIMTLIMGDGFPNCEAFVVDSFGHQCFLGSHVRQGPAPVMLVGNNKRLMISSHVRVAVTGGRFSGSVGVRSAAATRTMSFFSRDEWNQTHLGRDPNENRSRFWERVFGSVEGMQRAVLA